MIMIIISNLILLVTMLFLADHGRLNGVMNNKGIMISTVIAFLLIPSFVEILTALLAMLIPVETASIFSGVISFPILFIFVKVIINKFASIPKYQYDQSDKVIGAVFGVVKAFFIIVALVMFYGGFFIDKALPVKVTEAVKGNLANVFFSSQTDYYRYKIYTVYNYLSGAKISNINNDKPDSLGRTMTMLGALNVDSTGVIPKRKEADYSDLSWLGTNYHHDIQEPVVQLPDSLAVNDSIATDTITKTNSLSKSTKNK